MWKIAPRDELKIQVSEYGDVVITQRPPFEDEQVVNIHVDDIPRLIELLQTAANEAVELIVSGKARE